MPVDRRDIFTAHEIAQLAPLVNRDGVYLRFLAANRWMRQFMPNVHKLARLRYRHFSVIEKEAGNKTGLFANTLFEAVAACLQLWLINKHRSSETVSSSLLAFHPVDKRERVISQYKAKLISIQPQR